MLKSLLARWQQGHRTMKFPKGPPPALSERYRGRPVVDGSKCADGCQGCQSICPTGALGSAGRIRIDLGKCLFCGRCGESCPNHAVRFSGEYRQATRRREDLVVAGGPYRLADALEAKARSLFGRSLKLRQVSAGGCGACEADTNVLGTVGWDLGRFGIQFVASPRHADGLLVTGCVTDNMKLALEKTYAAVGSPKLVIAAGACAISGGPYIDHPEAHNGLTDLLPVDLFIPGCPPHPLTILDGLLRLLGRIEGEPAAT